MIPVDGLQIVNDTSLGSGTRWSCHLQMALERARIAVAAVPSGQQMVEQAVTFRDPFPLSHSSPTKTGYSESGKATLGIPDVLPVMRLAAEQGGRLLAVDSGV
jgi:hypothetical protein